MLNLERALSCLFCGWDSEAIVESRGRWKEAACCAEEPERLSCHETPRVDRDSSAFKRRIAFGALRIRPHGITTSEGV